jgi:sugar/nucleoside kinase (ribokinase family)
MKAAKAAGAKISLDLASFTVVEASREYLLELVKEYVDILLANEDEAAAFTGIREEEEALKILSSHAEVAALKVGAKGAYVVCDGKVYRIPPVAAPPQEIIDTTGAGDLWAAGFLYSLVNGLPPERCGLLASHCGYEVCRVIGAHIPEDGWERIRSILN